MTGVGGSALAGVDVGGGGVRVAARCVGAEARVEDTAAVPRVRGAIDVPRLVPRILDLLREAAHRSDTERFDRVAVGLTGLPDLVEDPDELVRLLRAGFPVGDLLLAADALTTHAGALGGRPGVVVAAGTGSVALGTDLHRLWRRTDGWGYLLGDRGSGAWIGREGLRRALLALDGLPGGSATLLARAERSFGGVRELEVALYRGGEATSSLLASFSPQVAEAAGDGDAVARRIWREAGTHLGETAAAAASPGLERTFSWGGKLFDAGALVSDPFRAAVLRRVPDARLVGPAGDALDGALALAAAEGPLAHRPPYLFRHDG